VDLDYFGGAAMSQEEEESDTETTTLTYILYILGFAALVRTIANDSEMYQSSKITDTHIQKSPKINLPQGVLLLVVCFMVRKKYFQGKEKAHGDEKSSAAMLEAGEGHYDAEMATKGGSRN